MRLATLVLALSLTASAAFAQPVRTIDPNGVARPLASDPNGNLLVASGGKAGVGTNRSASVTTTASNIMTSNLLRKAWKVRNDCAVDVWINFYATASAVAGGGNFKVAASGGTLSNNSDFVETGAMSAVAASGTCNLTVIEG